MNKDEYAVVNTTDIQKRIQHLKYKIKLAQTEPINTLVYRIDEWEIEIETLERVLSKSIPLIPEIEKTFNAGGNNGA